MDELQKNSSAESGFGTGLFAICCRRSRQLLLNEMEFFTYMSLNLSDVVETLNKMLILYPILTCLSLS